MPRSKPEYSDDLNQGVDYLELLGVDETASAEDVVSAFRAKIRAVHPDLNGGRHDPDAVGRIARARKTLTGENREAYLKAREAKREAQREASRPQPNAAPESHATAPNASEGAQDDAHARVWKWATEEFRRKTAAEARRRATEPRPRPEYQTPRTAPDNRDAEACQRVVEEALRHMWERQRGSESPGRGIPSPQARPRSDEIIRDAHRRMAEDRAKKRWQ
ncbi:MAG: hypothetical protein DIJKHBIC_02337 [Thermoanaerobaculia bacterium]|nr:hypothetical protein [Thermoanaerobaculia bacterium]